MGRPLGSAKKKPSEDGFDIKIDRSYSGLRRHFLVPPASVFRVMDGEWMKRKRQWIAIGIESEVGRGEFNLLGISDARNRQQAGGIAYPGGKKAATYGKDFAIGSKEKWEQEKKQGSGLIHQGSTIDTKNGEKWDGGRPAWQNAGTSIFDPVLCEIVYQWFCPEGGQIIDPFAGGSVRGIVAHVMGYKYWGSELRQEQVEANRKQAEKIVPDDRPTWVCADAQVAVPNAPKCDLIFSCPPYGDLEVYSDLPEDLSSMDYKAFCSAYREIIAAAVDRLKDNRFACFVVSNYRDERGFYQDLVGLTVRAFCKAGMGYYNEAVLVTAFGSLPVRITRQFQSGRKFGRTHQTVLVFYKGDPKAIKEEFGELSRKNERS